MIASPVFASISSSGVCTTKACKAKKLKAHHQQAQTDTLTQTTATKSIITEEVNPTDKQKVEIMSMNNLSGTFDIASDYRFRGVSQTQNLPAVQGGFTYSFPIGLYFNAWGSNVNFYDWLGNQATVELDTIIGWRGSFWDENISYDINVDRYNYPRARNANYNEINTLWTYKILQLGFSYSGNVYNVHKTGLYYNGTLTFPILPAMLFILKT